jgi:hypothetical protein
MSDFADELKAQRLENEAAAAGFTPGLLDQLQAELGQHGLHVAAVVVAPLDPAAITCPCGHEQGYHSAEYGCDIAEQLGMPEYHCPCKAHL